jgi:16S rRNA (uracil1498-N3)-methyltransferase
MNVQFYVHPSQIVSNMVTLQGDECIHATQVLRLREGDRCLATDGCGHRYELKLVSLAKKEAQAVIVHTESFPTPTTLRAVALGSLHKKDRIEWALEKAVELGVDYFYIYQADHSERARWKKSRLDQIILSASKQSKRTWFPKLILADNLQHVKQDAHQRCQGIELTLWAAHESASPNTRLPEKLTEGCNLFFIGPEGGFSSNELKWFDSESIPPFFLGDQLTDGGILRAETAVVTILAKYF